MTEERNRFPGAKPFTVNDQDVFYGRKNDVEKLFELLKVKRMIVLYAESGIGKSSLVNAGLIPRYKSSTSEIKFLAVKIRFGLLQFEDINKSSKEILLTRITEELDLHKNSLEIKSLPFTVENAENDLWYQVKLFERNNIRLLLAFDQFEEIFSYGNEQITLLKQQLFSVFSGVPKNLNERISEQVKLTEEQTLNQQELLQLDKDLQFIYTPLNAQILFIIREDKLGFFNSFTDYFGDILKDTFKLLPLSRDSAIEAITLPAGKVGNFKTNPFSFSQTALEKLLNRLAEKNGTYDPFTIQLMCRYIEKTLIDGAGKRVIEENDIPEVGIIVKDFIDSAWNALPKDLQKDVDKYKETIETKLIAADIEKRVSVHESDWINNKVVTTLINEGLLKRDHRGDVDYIELSHDRLVKPLLEDLKLRKQQQEEDLKLRKRQEEIRRRKRRNLIIGSIASAIILAAGFFIVISHIKETDILVENVDSLNKSTTQLKQSLATNINKVEDFEKKVSYDSAKTYCIEAINLAEKREFEKADNYFQMAVAASFKAGNSTYIDTINNFREQWIPKTVKNQSSNVYKADVFYDERTLPESEKTADWIIERLQTDKGFIVRKRLLPATKISIDASYDIQNNIVRYEQNKEETSLAKSLTQQFNAFDYIGKSNKIFSIQPVSSTFKSPNYISIFIHN